MLHAGECREDIARFCIESVLAAIDAMAEELLRQDGTYPFLFAGGVMSNRMIRDAIIQKYDASFAEPSFSCDNAAELLCWRQRRKKICLGNSKLEFKFSTCSQRKEWS